MLTYQYPQCSAVQCQQDNEDVKTHLPAPLLSHYGTGGYNEDSIWPRWSPPAKSYLGTDGVNI